MNAMDAEARYGMTFCGCVRRNNSYGLFMHVTPGPGIYSPVLNNTGLRLADRYCRLQDPAFLLLQPYRHTNLKTRQVNGEKRMQAQVPLHPYPCNILN